jgi:hypothetical protein
MRFNFAKDDWSCTFPVSKTSHVLCISLYQLKESLILLSLTVAPARFKSRLFTHFKHGSDNKKNYFSSAYVN